MNRRQFIKASIPAAVIPAIAITCKYEDDEKGPEKESKNCDWPYRVYCYEREQGEWTFSKNIRGSFAHQREYMTFEEEEPNGYLGFMYDGILHFQSLEDACDFVDMHVRTKDDINLIDSIYDVYYTNVYVGDDKTEIHVAHYWFNRDTGNQIHWTAEKPYVNYSKIEYA
jgi:hypothetical protein|tara:strand:+ start:714 stop:1220 length:507 start_codon:yes stop_codon:yes gene_type:complete